MNRVHPGLIEEDKMRDKDLQDDTWTSAKEESSLEKTIRDVDENILVF